MDDVFERFGILEVSLASPDDFLKIKETLTRIGIPSFKTKTLYQSCHIFHKQGRYGIVHFKELFALDGKPSEMTADDTERRNLVAKLIVEWGLCKPVNFDIATFNVGNAFNKTKIIKFGEKHEWKLESKHSLGKVSLREEPNQTGRLA
jgi:hypothetical protein